MNAPIHRRPDAERPSADALRETLFRPLGAKGLMARSGLYEGVVEALGHFVSRYRPAGCEVLRLPPVMSRSELARSGYLKSFPNLLGCVCCLGGSEADIRAAVSGDDWVSTLEPSDLVLTPAACYPVYPLAAARGPVPGRGLNFDVACDCFRREPSDDLDRLQSFRMREYVRIGAGDQILAFREDWMKRAAGLAESLGLEHEIVLANDPFFGRGAGFRAAIQREQTLKFELLVPILEGRSKTACMSFNYHQDHFGQAWDLLLDDGSPAHTGCVAFGVDRLALALFAAHGLETQAWPVAVRLQLGL